ncbi:DNA repair system specific for alkylated DNA [Moritella sp. PE36]|uniref:alpha-ketoglutarate-dependent dioxygenase AlkB n=1 Tax=Moritella sp. PE36 TaxID=58051 RepID=UPI0001568559|nr:alpha-ketoglutarate-dependent dioxygenase AlkB [Moritella sp. PE36]EDM67133.1 DNA repair system specific for alkylated DNA [Moritella sp. PE36]
MQLPINCNTQYIENFISKEDSSAIFDWIYTHVEGLDYENIEMADGSEFRLSVGKCMFVDEPLTNAVLLENIHGRRQHWPDVLLPVKQKIEQFTGLIFSVCVCIYYRDGNESVAFHYDPPAFGPTNVIPSLSLGQPREFIFRNKQDHSDQYSLTLGNGSLVIMGEGCQEKYEHALPVAKHHDFSRINLTFRQFNWPNSTYT